MNIDVLKDLSPAEPASAGDLPPFGLFAAGVYPFLEFRWFHEAYYRVLEAFAAGRVRRLIVTMPPQHGKSVGASTLLPAYLLGRNPDLRIAIASYSASLASKFNRRVQRIIDSPEYAAFFPETTIKRGARPPEYLRTADEVEIIGHRGGLLSVGREGALTGNRVDCFILDDLYKAWRAMQADPACIKKIHNKREAGNGLLVFLSYGTIRDIDDRQQIISLSYLMLSEEIEINPNSLNTIKNRILSMTIDREAFQYTVSAAIGTNAAFDFMGFSQFESRDAALKMLYKDLTLSPVFKNLPDFAEMLNDLEMKISNDFFGGHETPDSIKAQGETNHSKVLSYLREKVYEEECLDF